MPAGNKDFRQDLLLLVALFCFFFSGVAGLIYEVVWMRMLTQIFGNTTYAIATVLSSFMAGLALGSYFFGKLADRGKNDFLLYGILEAGVGIYGLLVPWLFKIGQVLYVPLYGLNESVPFLFNLLLFSLSFVLLVFPTILMGATLPVLSRFFVHSLAHLGRRVGNLYATNTLGAVIGCAAAGYVLIPNFGMRGALFIAAGLNLIIAVLIFIVDRLRDKKPIQLAEEPLPAGAPAGASDVPSWLGWVLLLSFGLSGFSALVYENAWTRALTMVLGSSVYSFTTMLVTFLIGLALGGFVYARFMGEREARVSNFGLIEFLVGFSALATIPLFEKLPLIFLRLLGGFGDSFALFLTIQLLLAALVMFLPTLFFGMTFPLVARLFTQSVYHVGTSVGTSYAANTLGAILGAFAGGFILIPGIGVQNTILVAVIINLLVGWFLVVVDPRYSLSVRTALGIAVMAAVILIPSRTPKWDPYVLTSGVTIYNERYEDLPLDSLRLEDMHRDEMLYYKEGLTATISVQRIGQNYIYWKTNGKIDGSHGDALTQLMSGYIGIFMNPGAKRAAVIGLGTGMTTRAISTFPMIEEIEVLEIEPAMVKTATFFNEKNGRILEDRRVRVIPTDGRNYILATPKKYDVISAEPSNPWIAGVANLYTREFYEVIKAKLNENGVFAQWVHNYSMSPDDFRMVFRTFGESFPHVTVWCMKESDFLMVGTMKEQVFNYRLLQEYYAKNEKMKADFKDLGLSDIYSVLGFYRMGKKELTAFTEGAEVNTDDGAQLEYSAPKSLRRATSTLNRKIMDPFLVNAPWLNSDSIPVPQPLRHFYLAQAYQGSAWMARAVEEVDKAIQLDPANPDFYVLKVKLFLEQEKSADAAQAALTALKLSPHAVPAILQMSDDFYLREAKTVYTKTIELGSREVLPYLGLGNIALHYRDLDEAEKWFGQARQIKADHPAVLLAWGRLWLAKDDFQKAKEFLEQSRAKGEESGTLYGALGDVYFNLKLWDQAVESYKEAFRSRRRNVDWRRKMGIAFAAMGKKREAEQKFREVLALTPDDSASWQELRKLGVRF
jgi:spermidine synthase